MANNTADTIQKNVYIKQGIDNQNYQQSKKRSFKYSEMQPKLIKRVSLKDKLAGKKDVYKLVPKVIGMSGADPVGKFIIESVALSPIFKIPSAGKKILKSITAPPKYTNRTLTGIDGKTYRVANNVSQDALDQYIADRMVYTPETKTIPKVQLIEQNVGREIKWAPESTQAMVKEAITKSKPLNLNKVKLTERRPTKIAYNRAKRAQKVVQDPKVRTYSNMQSMPEKELASYDYAPIAENIQGVHTPSGNYLNDIYGPNASSTALHEATHGYQELLPYSTKQKKLLQKTYLLPENPKHYESGLVDEMGATNAEFRGYLQDYFKTDSFDSQINNLTDQQVFNLFTKFKPNDYMSDYVEGLKNLQNISEWAKNFRKAQIMVPVSTGLLYNLKK